MRDDDILIDDDPPALARGWGAEDVRLLDELAQLGMALARELVADVQEAGASRAPGQAAPPPAPKAADVALEFSRISRAVRLSLALKAHALGAAGGAPSRTEAAGEDRWIETVVLDYPFDEPGYPDVDDLAGRADYRAGCIRAVMDHAITDPAHAPGEAERLREALEARIEAEREREHFLDRVAVRLIERIAVDLGLSGVWRRTRTAGGGWGGSLIARRGEDEGAEPIAEPEGLPDFASAAVGVERRGPRPPPDDAWRRAEEGAVAHAELLARITAWRQTHGPPFHSAHPREGGDPGVL